MQILVRSLSGAIFFNWNAAFLTFKNVLLEVLPGENASILNVCVQMESNQNIIWLLISIFMVHFVVGPRNKDSGKLLHSKQTLY